MSDEKIDKQDESSVEASTSEAFFSKEKLDENSSILQDLKTAHLNELKDLKFQLDEFKTKVTIIETTKQDELDELKFRSKEEIDSLNHIINALQSDLNSLRNDYELLNNNFKEIKRNAELIKSPTQQIANSTTSANSSTRNSPFANTSYHQNLNQENENLEEDMRKAKESADMLRSVVLPLETEITVLRSRSNTSEQRIKELEKLVEEKEKERQLLLEEERNIVNECLSKAIEADIDQYNITAKSITGNNGSDYFNKFIQLKKYLKQNETKFIELEKNNLKAIRQVYSLLSKEQKLKLIPIRGKSRSFLNAPKQENNQRSTDAALDLSTSTKLNESNELADSESLRDDKEKQAEEDFDLEFNKNQTINKIEELVNYLTSNEDLNSIDNKSSTSAYSASKESTTEFLLNANVLTYAELMALFEKEKNNSLDLETNFHQKAKESNRLIENLNKEMNNLATIIEDLRKQYINMQNQFQYQLDSLIKQNEELRSDMHQTELKNESYKSENLRLKAENKQFYGEQSILTRELDQQYHPAQNLEEAQRQLISLRSEMVKLILANQALNKQLNQSLETVKHLQKTNIQYQKSNNSQDQLVMMQSLESELERERKVRIETENEMRDAKAQSKTIKEKSQHLVDSLRQKNEHNEFEIRKLKDENQELTNQIQSLKKDSKNSLSVQEDLVRLIQSLQIELNQMKIANEPSSSQTNNQIEVRCQHEDDFNECAECKNVFSVTKRKHRCKHCCKIFCSECCAKTVLSGPNLRPHKVCNSCHTLLDKDDKLSPSSSSST